MSQDQRHRIIVTDGVFSMDGDIAKMNEICDLADKYDALVMSDECHSAGFIGKTGRGVPEFHGVMDRLIYYWYSWESFRWCYGWIYNWEKRNH